MNTKIDDMNGEELKEKLLKILARKSINIDDSEWEGTDDGIDAMHALIRVFGLEFVDEDAAPKNWAWILVGELGCGFRAVFPQFVHKALKKTVVKRGIQ